MSVLSMMLAFLMVPAAKQQRGEDRVRELESENETLTAQVAALQGGHAADQITIATWMEIARQRERSAGVQRGLVEYWQNTARSLMREPDTHFPRQRERMEQHQQQMLMGQTSPLAQAQQNQQALAQGHYFGDCTCIPDRAAALGVPARQRMIGIGALGSPYPLVHDGDRVVGYIDV